MKLLLVAALLLWARPLWAWNPTGHMLVADIAERHLKPAVRQRLLHLLSIADNPQSGKQTTDEDDGPITAATYMDDIRPTFRNLHFIDEYLDEEGRPTGQVAPGDNALTEVRTCIGIVQDARSSDAAKAEAVRYIMHLVGDLHQPLHCVARVTPDHPQGDRGANDFLLPDRFKNLHRYWDDAAGTFFSLRRPLSANSQRRLDQLADELEAETPRTAAVDDLIVMDWVHEGMDLARTVVYRDVSPDVEPSERYRMRTIRICRQRVTLAGYRLAKLLNTIL